MSASRRETQETMISELRQKVRWLEKRKQPAGAKKLDDLSDVTIRDPVTAQVVTFDGSQWVNAAPEAAAGLDETILTYTDDGTFGETAPFDTSFSVPTTPLSRQLVTVTAFVECSESALLTFRDHDDVEQIVSAPTPWKLTAFDGTTDPTAEDAVGDGSVGSGTWAQCSVWLTNETDDVQVTTLYASVEGLTSAYEFDGTVTVTARSRYLY